MNNTAEVSTTPAGGNTKNGKDALTLLVEAGFSLSDIFQFQSEAEKNEIPFSEYANAVLRLKEKGIDIEGIKHETNTPAPQTKINSEIQKIIEMLEAIHPEENTSDYSWDDAGQAKLFAHVFKDRAKFNTTSREWFYYNEHSGVWQEDTGGMIVSNFAKQFQKSLVAYVVNLQSSKLADEFLRLALKYGSYKQRQTLISDAKDQMFVTQETFDADDTLLNCRNGVLNLSDFSFREHDAADLLTKSTNAIYDPAARSERWEKFIDEVMEGDREKTEYLQKLFGYSLTAETNIETCWLFYGPSTRNGKSTLIETFLHMFGDYGATMKPETLALKKNNDSRTASPDVARLNGCRFLNASEPPKKMLLDAALLKTLIGRDKIVARQLYQKEIEFLPKFKLCVNTNHLPVVTDASLFASGRLNIVTFNRHFSPEEQNTHLKDELKTDENISGILNWCIVGLAKYRQEGLKPPEAVINATRDYQEQSDKIKNFLNECMIETGKNSSAGAAYSCFAKWCSENGFGTDSKRTFFDDLKSKGLFAASGTISGKTCHNVIKSWELAISEDEIPLPWEA